MSGRQEFSLLELNAARFGEIELCSTKPAGNDIGPKGFGRATEQW